MIRYFKVSKRLSLYYFILNCLYTFCCVYFTFIFANIIEAASSKNVEFIVEWLVFCVVFMIMYCGISYFYFYVKNKIIEENNINLKNQIFQSLYKKSIAEFELCNSASYIADLTASIERLDRVYYEMILDIPHIILTFVFSIIASLWLSPLLLLPMLGISIISVYVSHKSSNTSSQEGEKFTEATENYTVTCKEYLEGFSLIKLSGIACTVSTLHEIKNKEMERARFNTNQSILKTEYISLAFSLITSVVLVAFAGILSSLNLLTLAGVYAVGDLIGKMLYPMGEFMTYQSRYQSVVPLLNRMDTLVNSEDQKVNETSLTDFTHLEVKNVSFAYDERTVLENISLDIRKGGKYCLVGVSGCGKSTLLKLLQGYYDTYTGTITYNELNYLNINKDSLNKKIGTLSQSVFLFDASLRDNVTLFQKYSDSTINEVLDKVGLTKFVNQLPHGLDTIVGENGKSVSGGEKTRIALARLLLMEYEVILLDEVCASLDNETADKIEKLILSLDQTVISVSHRLSKSFLEKCDEIIVLKDGQVIEMGTLNELEIQNGYFNALYVLDNK